MYSETQQKVKSGLVVLVLPHVVAIVHEDITTPGHTPIHHPLLTFGESGHELMTSHTPLHREVNSAGEKNNHMHPRKQLVVSLKIHHMMLEDTPFSRIEFGESTPPPNPLVLCPLLYAVTTVTIAGAGHSRCWSQPNT